MTQAPDPQPTQPAASVFSSMLRGFRRSCPRCGKGLLFNGYLKPRPACSICCAETGQIYTADIAPYFTIMVVGHIIVPLVLMMEQYAAPPLWLQAVVWPSLTLAFTLWLLPRVKGSIMGLMWVLGMRGHEHQ